MARTAGVLAALALMPAAAAAQNGYSFIDADKSAVRFNVATVKPALPCVAVAGLATPDTTILSVHTVPAAWNRRFYMHGNGGFAGENPEFGPRPMVRANALKQGFAVVQTNTATTPRPSLWRASPPTTRSGSTMPSVPST